MPGEKVRRRKGNEKVRVSLKITTIEAVDEDGRKSVAAGWPLTE